MDINRHAYYGLIQDGVKELVVERLGHYSEQEYHQILTSMTGKSDCFMMSNQELEYTLEHLKNEGYLSGTAVK